MKPIAEFLTKTLPAFVLSTLLFIGGIVLLSLRIPGWSLLLGIPATQLGIAFLVFTFDKIALSRLDPDNLHFINCSNCGKPILAPHWQKEEICQECLKKLLRS